MAQRVQTVLISDLSGKEIADGDGETVTLSVRGAQYELDLSGKEAAQLDRDLKKYLDAARRVGGGRARSSKRGTASGNSKSNLQDIREWARRNGYNVSDRGRVPGSVLDAYHAAH